MTIPDPTSNPLALRGLAGRLQRNKLLRVLALLFLVYWGGGFFVQRQALYPSGLTAFGLERTLSSPLPWRDTERLWVEHGQGRSEAWLALPPGASSTSPAPLVVFAHGNAELIEHHRELVAGFRARGWAVVLCEYRGYGLSEGSPSQAAIVADHLALLEQLDRREDLDATRRVYYGRSLGGGVACALARERAPDALILQSSFRSMGSMFARYLFPPALVRDRYENAEVLATFEGPVLIVHGRADRIVPFEHGEALRDAAREARAEAERSEVLFVAFDCGHNDFPVHGDAHWAAVDDLLELLPPTPPSESAE